MPGFFVSRVGLGFISFPFGGAGGVGGKVGVGDLVCPVSSSMAVLLTRGEDGHVHSTNNNSNHATSASCVKVETGFPAPSST